MEPIRISTPLAEAELYSYGAHLARWTPRGHRPVLYLSPRSLFTPGKGIRGGVPIIFPWFGPKEGAAAHGFARTSEWSVESQRTLEDGRVEIALVLANVRFRLTIGLELKMELETTNVGKDVLVFEEALHTYFTVGDVEQVTVAGLEGAEYLDKTDDYQRKRQAEEPIRFDRETDRTYVNTRSTCTILDPSWERRIVVEKSGSASTVVWNPWIEKAMAMSDMEPDGWKQMVCVETGNIGENAVRLAPGESHTMTATIRVE
ncbi:MAG: D-hexose-6-phosphate mutarotase [Bryobacteraceae bacterium]